MLSGLIVVMNQGHRPAVASLAKAATLFYRNSRNKRRCRWPTRLLDDCENLRIVSFLFKEEWVFNCNSLAANANTRLASYVWCPLQQKLPHAHVVLSGNSFQIHCSRCERPVGQGRSILKQAATDIYSGRFLRCRAEFWRLPARSTHPSLVD